MDKTPKEQLIKDVVSVYGAVYEAACGSIVVAIVRHVELVTSKR